MAQKQSRAVRANGTAPGICQATKPCAPEYNSPAIFRQDLPDPVAILATRSRVAPATVRAQLAAWHVGGAA